MRYATRWLAVVGGLWILAAPALAQESVDKLEEQLRTTPAPPPRPEPGYLGAVTDDRQPQAGVQVMQVTPNSPAAAAGLLPGDLIVAVNGQPIQRMVDFARYMTASAAGTRLSFRVDRNGRETAVAVTLGARPNDAGPFGEAAAPPAAAGNSPQELLLGVATIPLSTADRRRLGVPVARGAVVASLTPQSPAAAGGVPLDAVIVGVNNLIVEDPTKLDARLQALGPGRVAEIAFYQGNRLVRRELQLAVPAAQPPTNEGDMTQRLQELERRVQELELRVRELEK